MTTYTDVEHGALLKCNNTTILCNTEKWLVDGSVNLRDISNTTTSYTDVSMTTTSYSNISYS